MAAAAPTYNALSPFVGLMRWGARHIAILKLTPSGGDYGLAGEGGSEQDYDPATGYATADVLGVADVPLFGATAMLVGDPAVAAGRQFGIFCTVAGNVTVKFLDASTLTIPVLPSTIMLPWAVIQVTAATATATYANFK